MLDSAFPNKIQYFPVKDIDATGNFEVTILNEEVRKLIHSKTMMGQGRCESRDEQDRLVSIVQVVVNFLDKKFG